MRFAWRSGSMVLAIVLLWVTGGCYEDPPDPPPSDQTGEKGDGVKSAREAPKLLPLDLPLPEFRLADSTGNAFGSRELARRPYLVNFIFTRCQLTCPEQTRRMVEFQKQLARKIEHQHSSEDRGGPKHILWDHLQIVSLSVDPEKDTPEVLSRYADNYGAKLENWSFLTGKKSEIFSLITDGFKLPVAEVGKDQPIVHTVKVALVDHRGLCLLYTSDAADE